jgi:2-methylcitrate dehydratase
MTLIPRRSLLAGVTATGFSALARGVEGPQSSRPQTSAGPLADRLAAYAERLSYRDIGATTLEAVRVLVVDAFGCAIAAFDERPVRICREIAAATGGGSSTILGTHRRTTPDLAAFANAAAIRYYDLNDVYVSRQANHPSDSIAACFAIAEAEKVGAKDLIAAIVVAYEIECRLGDAFDLSARRFDATIFTLPAVALAAS